MIELHSKNPLISDPSDTDDRRAAGEPDFQPGQNQYPIPENFPVNHELSPKFRSYFTNGIQLKHMKGVMVNFNYPESFHNMFSNLESEIDLQFTESENGFR